MRNATSAKLKNMEQKQAVAVSFAWIKSMLVSGLQSNKGSGEKQRRSQENEKGLHGGGGGGEEEKAVASRRGQRPRVRVPQTRLRGPWDHSEASLCVWVCFTLHFHSQNLQLRPTFID